MNSKILDTYISLLNQIVLKQPLHTFVSNLVRANEIIGCDIEIQTPEVSNHI